LVFKHEKTSQLLKKILQITKEEKITHIVLGISENKMGKTQREFKNTLQKETHLPVTLWDETLTTKDAQTHAVQASIKKSKRKSLEDAFAAAILLQSYLDSK
jgi:putative Holliday junction resolvase